MVKRYKIIEKNIKLKIIKESFSNFSVNKQIEIIIIEKI